MPRFRCSWSWRQAARRSRCCRTCSSRRSPHGGSPATAFWTPLLLPAVVVLAIGLELNPVWSMSGFTLLPVVLLSSPLIAVSQAATRAIVMLAVVTPPLMAVAAPGIAIATHRAGAITSTAAHGRLLAQRVEQEWRRISDQPLRLVGGDLDLANTVAFYLPDRPSTLPVGEPQACTVGKRRTRRARRDRDRLPCDRSALPAPAGAGSDRGHEAKGPPGHRVSVEIARTFFGIPGPPAHYVIVTVPPRR